MGANPSGVKFLADPYLFYNYPYLYQLKNNQWVQNGLNSPRDVVFLPSS